MNKINFLKKISILILVSVIFTISSLFWTTYTVYNRTDLGNVKLGWPFYFEVQDQTRFDPPFPYVRGRAWESPIQSFWTPFLGSLMINFLIVTLVIQFFSFVAANFSKKKIFVLVLVSIGFTISSLFWTTYEARKRDDLQRVQFGWPFPFEIQRRFNFESSLPHKFYRSGDYLDRDFLKSQFLGSLIINSMLIASLWSLIDPQISKGLNKKQS